MDPGRGGVKPGLRSQIASPTQPQVTQYHKRDTHTHIKIYSGHKNALAQSKTLSLDEVFAQSDL